MNEGIRVRKAAFTYRKDSPAGAAYIRLPEVVADVSAFGSYGKWLEMPVTGEAVALLEKSGKVNLTVKAWLNKGGPYADVDLRLAGQRLDETNDYFEPEEGVTLRGLLISSHAQVSLRDHRAEGNVVLKYEGLGLVFHPNRHRGGLKAFFTNLGTEIGVNRGNSREPRTEREKSVVTSRHARESVVSFVLRTMREAAMRVATN